LKGAEVCAVRKLFRYEEAVDSFLGGDRETLRQAVLLGEIDGLVEYRGVAYATPWVPSPRQEWNTDISKWIRSLSHDDDDLEAFRLDGWFYLDQKSATKLVVCEMDRQKITGGLDAPKLLQVSFGPSTEICDLFFGNVPCDEMWFLATDLDALQLRLKDVSPRTIGSADETLTYMAENVNTLSDDAEVITRFKAAAIVGTDGIDIGALDKLILDYDRLSAIAIARAAMANVREEQRQQRAKGGRAKASNAKPNPEIAVAREYARKHPSLSATQIKMKLKLRASDRTIRQWLSASR
jgi:hypothetical protein